MIKLIKNADVYAPEHLGVRDILICGEKISAVGENLDVKASEGIIEVVDLHGAAIGPGYIDGHVHITGGGGHITVFFKIGRQHGDQHKVYTVHATGKHCGKHHRGGGAGIEQKSQSKSGYSACAKQNHGIGNQIFEYFAVQEGGNMGCQDTENRKDHTGENGDYTT